MLKVGIIGCGGIANQKHLPALAGIEEVGVVALCDIIEERAILSKNTYGTSDGRVYSDYKEMLEKEDLDIVHVCTPNSSHAEISIAAMEADNHVMCEKPMAKTSDEARERIDAAEQNKKKLTIGYQNRFRADSQHLRKVTQRGD